MYFVDDKKVEGAAVAGKEKASETGVTQGLNRGDFDAEANRLRTCSEPDLQKYRPHLDETDGMASDLEDSTDTGSSEELAHDKDTDEVCSAWSLHSSSTHQISLLLFERQPLLLAKSLSKGVIYSLGLFFLPLRPLT